jgi:hypothetical protein
LPGYYYRVGYGVKLNYRTTRVIHARDLTRMRPHDIVRLRRAKGEAVLERIAQLAEQPLPRS